MDLKDYVSISGEAGLYKTKATRSNGLVVEDIDNGKSRFFSVRKHQFTPLESIAIYTESDTVPLTDVFKAIQGKMEESPIPESGASNDLLFAYFGQIVPDYDREQVKISDVKKVLKWYRFLAERDLLVDASSEEE